ncbi:CBS domain-containing protein [Streptosporangium sp. NPDC000396]|uniref:CBS domain-containing protein n=1 Tax=Streptosporangium sp. NPDC000396 TaxID=3366185 RepID=UPI0036B9E3B3
MQAKDVMSTMVVTVRPEASFIDVVGAMVRFKVNAITVVDADERPIGVISEEDLLLKEIGPGRHTDGVLGGGSRREGRGKAVAATAGEIMTTPAVTVMRGTSVRDVVRLMHRHRVKQLPVIDAVTGRVAGTVHQGDLLKIFTRPAEEIDREITEICDRLCADREGLVVGIESGVVTLEGRVGFRSQISRLVAAAREIEGVLAVESRLTYQSDDMAGIPAPPPATKAEP